MPVVVAPAPHRLHRNVTVLVLLELAAMLEIICCDPLGAGGLHPVQPLQEKRPLESNPLGGRMQRRRLLQATRPNGLRPDTIDPLDLAIVLIRDALAAEAAKTRDLAVETE